MKRNDEFLIKLGKRIKHLRTFRNLSQEQLAEKADMHANYISRIERAVTVPSVDALYNLSRAFNMDLPTLLCFDKLD